MIQRLEFKGNVFDHDDCRFVDYDDHLDVVGKLKAEIAFLQRAYDHAYDQGFRAGWDGGYGQRE